MKNLSSEQLFLTQPAKALLNKSVRSPFFNLSRYQLWDIVGSDSVQLVKLLFSDAVTSLAPFQSLDVIFTGYQYSALRLGESNFRLGLYGEQGDYGGLTFEQTLAQARRGLQVWAKRWDEVNGKNATASLKAIALPQFTALDLLPQIAVVRAPHCLEELPPNHAIPARLDGISVLIWRHQLLSESAFELHTAVRDAEAIEVKLINIGLRQNSLLDTIGSPWVRRDAPN